MALLHLFSFPIRHRFRNFSRIFTAVPHESLPIQKVKLSCGIFMAGMGKIPLHAARKKVFPEKFAIMLHESRIF